jgi:hypothetical protein
MTMDLISWQYAQMHKNLLFEYSRRHYLTCTSSGQEVSANASNLFLTSQDNKHSLVSDHVLYGLAVCANA